MTKAVNAYFIENYKAGKETLRQLIHATIGFNSLGKEVKKSSKSLHRMLGPRGNPNAGNFFAMLSVLQKHIGVHLTVKTTRTLPSKARMGRNPQTSEVLRIPAKRAVKFRAAITAKDTILSTK